jgi:exocyst complex component 4
MAYSGGYGGGGGGYSNGYGSSNPYALNDPDLPGSSADERPLQPPPRSRERRGGQYGQPGYGDPAPAGQSSGDGQSGGYGQSNLKARGGYGEYGGYGSSSREEGTEEEQSDAGQVRRPISLERAQAQRRSAGTSPWGRRSPTRRGVGQYADGTKLMEEILATIQRDYPFITDDRLIPVQTALQFMDPSSLGMADRYPQFKELHRALQNSLRQIVNEHHQGFNSSIGTFHSFQTSLQSSQHRLRVLKDSLGTADTNLSTVKSELNGLTQSSQNYDDMLTILATIEHLQGIPEQLEARISDKRFLTAVELLQDGLKSMKKPNMDEIGALSDLRVYLSNQEHSLTDILIEELHNHLYLKSPYCESRWKQYTNSHANGVSKDGEPSNIGPRELYQFLDKLDTDTIINDDLVRNPESDSFAYLHLLIESLNALGRLDVAVETITQRLPVELFRVVEKCNAEVDQRYPAGLRGGKGSVDPLDFSNPAKAAVINDLLSTLYARFEAIAEAHRVVHEVISGITKRQGTRGTTALTGGFRELWKLYQSVIRSLLHDYLASNSDSAFGNKDDGLRGANVFQRRPKDKSKNLFKLTDMDANSTDIVSETTDLDAILKASVPGLVSASKATDSMEVSANTAAQEGGSTGHKLLVESSVFNMGILLPPSLTFLSRLKEVVPPTSDIVMSSLTSFLDDFLINVFHPQLDETLVEMCSQLFIETDCFQQDPQWTLHAKKPIFKGTAKFFYLIEAFCKMLDSLPHDQAFTQLIITQIVNYYDKCHGWYRVLVARGQPHPQSRKRLKLSAAITDGDEVKQLLEQLLNAKNGDRQELIRKVCQEANPRSRSILIQARKRISSSRHWTESQLTRSICYLIAEVYPACVCYIAA